MQSSIFRVFPGSHSNPTLRIKSIRLAQRLFGDNEDIAPLCELDSRTQSCNSRAHHNEVNPGRKCHLFEAITRLDSPMKRVYAACEARALLFSTYPSISAHFFSSPYGPASTPSCLSAQGFMFPRDVALIASTWHRGARSRAIAASLSHSSGVSEWHSTIKSKLLLVSRVLASTNRPAPRTAKNAPKIISLDLSSISSRLT